MFCTSPVFGYFFGTHTFNGLDSINGTHFLDVPYYLDDVTVPDYCVDNRPDSLPGRFFPYPVDSIKFELTKDLSGRFYNSNTCVQAAFLTEETVPFEVTLEIAKVAGDHYRVSLTGAVIAPASTWGCLAIPLLLGNRGLSSCQNLGCENQFDSLVDYPTTDSDLTIYNTNTFSNPCGGDPIENLCSDGIIYFRAGSGDSCGQVGSKFCPDEVGTIFAEVVR